MSTPTPPPVPQAQGLGHIVNGVTWPFTALSILVVAFRFYIRKRFTSILSSDDWFMLLALAFNIVFQACLTAAVYWGYSKPRVTIPPDDAAKAFFYQHLCITWAQLTDVIARVSISILLARIFGTARPWFKWFLIVFSALQAVVSGVAVILGWTEVTPVQALWDFRIKREQKIPILWQQNMSLASAWIIAFTDLSYVLIPVIFIWSLRMPLHRKLGVCALMATSLVAAAAAITKIAIVMLVRDGKISLSTGHSVSIFITSGLEQSLVIIMGCVPALAPIRKLELHLKFNAIGQSIASLLTRRSGGSSSGSSHRSGGSRGKSAGHDSASEKGGRGSDSDVERQAGSRGAGEKGGMQGIVQTQSYVVTTVSSK